MQQCTIRSNMPTHKAANEIRVHRFYFFSHLTALATQSLTSVHTSLYERYEYVTCGESEAANVMKAFCPTLLLRLHKRRRSNLTQNPVSCLSAGPSSNVIYDLAAQRTPHKPLQGYHELPRKVIVPLA